jgi:hypothetical protein
VDPKKRRVGASERDEFLRIAWRVLVARALDQRRLVFVDEMGTTTSLAPLYAWAPKGERARCEVPRNRGKNTTLLASMTAEDEFVPGGSRQHDQGSLRSLPRAGPGAYPPARAGGAHG